MLALAALSAPWQWMAFYDDSPNETAAFTNLRLSATPAEAAAAGALGLRSLLAADDALWQFGPQGRLRPDYAERWSALAKEAAPLLKAGTALGFNLGDELVWNCVPPEVVAQGAAVVRASFPDAIIWYNEAGGPVIANQAGAGCTGPSFNFTIPKSLSWFSVDCYHMDGLVEGWVDRWVRTLYTEHIYPRLGAEQKALLVPGSFGSDVNHWPNGTAICDRHCYDVMCAHDAHDFAAWAEADERVVAVAPWNWGGCATCNGSRFTPPHTCCMDEIGTREMPLTRAAWSAIGKRIKGRGL